MSLAKIGKYEIHEKLGEGATAEVYRAVDTSLGREVALKILKPALVADASAFARFVQEARAAAGLFQSNIATVLEVGEDRGRYFIAMRYFPGRSLDKVLKDGPLAPKDVVALATQVADALDYAHKEGFLHRDVKPSNIIQVQKDNYVLTDFGLARAMLSSGFTSHSGAALGTPSYIAPEIWLNQPATQATDQYALACVIYEALTGQVLFTGDTPPAIMTGHILNEPRLPKASEEGIPSAAEEVLSRALMKEPLRRFASVGEFAREFREAMTAPRQVSSRGAKKKLAGDRAGSPPVTDSKPAPKSGEKKSSAGPDEGQPWSIRNLANIRFAGIVVVSITLVALMTMLFKVLPSAIVSTATATQTLTPSPIPLPTRKLTPTPTPFPTEIIDAKGVPMRLVPAGTFTMGDDHGSTAERPAHTVYLDAYYIDKYEVTNSLYKACGNEATCIPRSTSSDLDDYPLTSVGWSVARAYCESRSADLPTEAQWEKAARGTDGRMYPWGNDIGCKEANILDCGYASAVPVGSFEDGISPYGLYDMSGNVWEWVKDWFLATYYQNSPFKNPLGPPMGQERVIRGGSWNEGGTAARTTTRVSENPQSGFSNVGFRCVHSANNSPAFTGQKDSDLIVYELHGDIYTMKSDGSNITQLTNGMAKDYHPVWSPNGSQIAFGSDRNGRDAIYIMNSDGSNITKLVDTNGSPDWPAEFSWSPGGDKIVYVDSESFLHGNIYVVETKGSQVNKLVDTLDVDRTPAWSPNGLQIAFARLASLDGGAFDGNPLIYVMNADGSNIRQVTNHDMLPSFFNPAWSPDGSRIAFVGGHGADIYTMNADATDITQLTDTTNAREDFPAWSPDGRYIAFEYNNGAENFSTPEPPEASNIYIMNSDGTNPVRLTRGQSPSWRP